MCKLKTENEQQNWPKLYNAINNRDVNGIADNVHRKDEGWKEMIGQNKWHAQSDFDFIFLGGVTQYLFANISSLGKSFGLS